MKLPIRLVNLIIFLSLATVPPFLAWAEELENIINSVQAQYSRINDFSTSFLGHPRLITDTFPLSTVFLGAVFYSLSYRL